MVDRVGDADRCCCRDQPEVAYILQVVVVRVELRQCAGQHRFDDAADAGLGEACGQGVEVGGTGENQPLLGRFHVIQSDPLWGGNREFLDDFTGQRVDQPRLPGGQLDRPVHRLCSERLAGLGGVLGVELADLVGGEISQPQRLQLDIEGAGGAEPVRVATGGDFVVADVAKAAQRHRCREPVRALVVTGPELAQDADQALAAQGVDLVEEQYQRPWAGTCPRF